MDQVTKVKQISRDDNAPYYNYELIVSQYQILNSLQNQKNFCLSNAQLHHEKINSLNEQQQQQKCSVNKSIFPESNYKSQSIINLINSDNNVSNSSVNSKPTSIQNDFTKIKQKILKRQQSQDLNIKMQTNELKQQVDCLQYKNYQLESRQRYVINTFKSEFIKIQQQAQKDLKIIYPQINATNIVKILPEFVIQDKDYQQYERQEEVKQQYELKVQSFDRQLQNKLTAPSVNVKNNTNEDEIIQQHSFFANSQLEQDYFQFIYKQLLTKTKQNSQLKGFMQIINQKIMNQQSIKLQFKFKEDQIQQSKSLINQKYLKNLKQQNQLLSLQLNNYKSTSDKLNNSVKQKNNLLFQYFINKQSKLDKIYNQKQLKILQLKLELSNITQNSYNGQFQSTYQLNNHLKSIFEEQRKKYLKTKAKSDSSSTSITYLKQKKDNLLNITQKYLYCAKKGLQNALNSEIIKDLNFLQK